MRARLIRLRTGAALSALAAPVATGAEPTEYEQYALELLNRARANPQGEVTRTAADAAADPPPFGFLYDGFQFAPALNEGPPSINGNPYTIPTAPKQPLAFNPSLIDVTRNYAAVCQQNNGINHYYNGTTPEGRMQAGGYTTGQPFADALQVGNTYWMPGSENLYMMLTSEPWDAPIDGVDPKLAAMLVGEHGLFVDRSVSGRGHRITMMARSWREIGIGANFGTDPPSWNSVYICYDFGFVTGGNPFITGVAYLDVTGDGFYTPGRGESRGGQTVRVLQAGTSTEVATTTTYSTSGGYSVAVPPNASYDVVFSGSAGTQTVRNVTVAGENVKVDWRVSRTAPPPTPLDITSVVRNGNDLVITWSSNSGVTYRVARSANLVAWEPITSSTTTATGGTSTFRVVNGATGAPMNYRVEQL